MRGLHAPIHPNAAAQIVRAQTKVYAVVGGFHLYAARTETLAWTADQLKAFGVTQMIGAHCTGIEPVYYFREHLGLDRQNCVVGAVGASFDLQRGINPGELAH